MVDQTDAQRLAEANDILIGVVENGPWVLITDPALRQIVGEYVTDTCHSVASAAGLDEAMERAHDAMPQRLAQSLPGQPSAAKCTATYPDAPENDQRCVQCEGHQPAVALHYNRAGFAWADDEVLLAVVVDARERLARHLFLAEWPDSRSAQRAWDEKRITRDPYMARAKELVAVITGQETGR